MLTLYYTRKSCTNPNSKHLQTTNKNVTRKLRYVLGMVENMLEKGENAGNLPAFSPFPKMLSKVFFPRVDKSRNCVVNS